MSSLLQVIDLSHGFGTGATRLEVLKGINLSIVKGEVVALMGPSGCGKSTLLNIIGGLLEAESGEIELAGAVSLESGTAESFKYGTRHPRKVVDVRRRGVGWIFQDYYLLDQLTAFDNVVISLELAGVDTSEAEGRARKALIKVDLENRMDFLPEQLSGGQQQRVAIARAIAGSRPLLLADEPTGNLDVKTGEGIIELFKELCSDRKEPISILMVTHDPHLASKADRMLLLKDGLTVASDIRSAWGIVEKEE